jgi:hypothetical protein
MVQGESLYGPTLNSHIIIYVFLDYEGYISTSIRMQVM